MAKLWRRPFDADIKSTVPPHVEISRDRCKGCGYCSEFCPRDVIQMTTDINERGYTPAAVADGTKCLGCGLCEIICPEFAVAVAPRHGRD